MPLGTTSRERLSTCHPDLQRLIRAVADGVDEGDLSYAGIHDITVLCGFRGEADQNAAVARGASKTPWPRSKHNVLVEDPPGSEEWRPQSDAVDVGPYPVPSPWDDEYARKLEVLHAYTAGVAHQMGIDLFDISWDRPHIQRNVP